MPRFALTGINLPSQAGTVNVDEQRPVRINGRFPCLCVTQLVPALLNSPSGIPTPFATSSVSPHITYAGPSVTTPAGISLLPSTPNTTASLSLFSHAPIISSSSASSTNWGFSPPSVSPFPPPLAMIFDRSIVTPLAETTSSTSPATPYALPNPVISSIPTPFATSSASPHVTYAGPFTSAPNVNRNSSTSPLVTPEKSLRELLASRSINEERENVFQPTQLSESPSSGTLQSGSKTEQ